MDSYPQGVASCQRGPAVTCARRDLGRRLARLRPGDPTVGQTFLSARGARQTGMSAPRSEVLTANSQHLSRRCGGRQLNGRTTVTTTIGQRLTDSPLRLAL